MPIPLWQQLTELVNSQQELKDLADKRVTLRTQIDEKREAIAEASSMLEEKRALKKVLRKDVDGLELTSKELEASEKSKKAAYEKLSGQKEIKALEKELATLASAQEDNEAKLIAAWQAHETCELDLAALESTLAEQVSTVEQEVITLEDEFGGLDKKEADFHANQAANIAALPQLWQSRYQQMKDRIENPIVPLLDTSCSQCFYLVLAKDLTRIRKGDVLPCRNCYRYLYYTEQAPEEVPASASAEASSDKEPELTEESESADAKAEDKSS